MTQPDFVKENVELAPYTTWKIGGRARFFAEVDSVGEVRQALAYAASLGLPVRTIGGGSNILVSDEGFPGLILKLKFKEIERFGNRLTAGAGVPMGRLAVYSLQQNLSGVEWAVGIPGTVGGAVYGNSNCFGGSTAGSVHSAVILSPDGRTEPRVEGKEYFEFSYDFSKLQKSGEIVLKATFELTPVDDVESAKIRKNISEAASVRSKQQPLGSMCAGSTFKALIPTPAVIEKISSIDPKWERGLRDGFISAGYIIDKLLGLKGKQYDRMKISDVHANFFINLGGATSKNVKELIDDVKKKCHNIIGIDLEEEIKYVE